MAQRRYDVATNGDSFHLTAHGPLSEEAASLLPPVQSLLATSQAHQVLIVNGHGVAGSDGCSMDPQVDRLLIAMDAYIKRHSRPQ